MPLRSRRATLAWDHQKLFTAARALELELGLTPLRSRAREREKVPQRAADCEAHHGVDSFARWAGEKLRPAFRATELRSWDSVHDVCSRFGVVIRPHGNGLVFEDTDRAGRVKASFVERATLSRRLKTSLDPGMVPAMSKFDLASFVEGCKLAMANADDRHEAARTFLQETLDAHDADEIIEVLEASIPPGANIGELIVHADADLTVLYGRVPPRLQSGIHNHTVFACIGQLNGDEENTFYEKTEDGAGLRLVRTTTVKEGRVIGLPADVIHSIANPDNDVGRALHIYGGDFGVVMGERSLWTADAHEEIPFSFEGLLKESIKTMKRDNNETGLRAVAVAIPETAPIIEPLLS